MSGTGDVRLDGKPDGAVSFATSRADAERLAQEHFDAQGDIFYEICSPRPPATLWEKILSLFGREFVSVETGAGRIRRAPDGSKILERRPPTRVT